MSWGRVLGSGMVVAAVGLSGCSDDSEDSQSSTSVASIEVSRAYAPGESLDVLRDTAADLERVGSTGAEAVCAEAAGRLDEAGDPGEMADVAASLDDLEVREAALEQHAAVSSVLAACRGDAPVSVAEAVQEMVVSNDALDLLLVERGVEG